jgi:hypothetical protein
MRKRLVVPIAVLIAAGLAGGAYAASQTGGAPGQTFINDAARRLHVSPSQLTSVLRQSMIDRINAAAAKGQLSRAQATALVNRLEHSPGLPFGPLALLVNPGLGGVRIAAAPPLPPQMLGRGPIAMRMFGRRGMPIFKQALIAGPPFGPPAIFPGAASYLGLSERQLIRDLSAGKSLAAIAKAQGKTQSGLEQAIMSAVSSADRQRLAAIMNMSWRAKGFVRGVQVPLGALRPAPFLGGFLGPLPAAKLRAFVQRVPHP